MLRNSARMLFTVNLPDFFRGVLKIFSSVSGVIFSVFSRILIEKAVI